MHVVSVPISNLCGKVLGDLNVIFVLPVGSLFVFPWRGSAFGASLPQRASVVIDCIAWVDVCNVIDCRLHIGSF